MSYRDYLDEQRKLIRTKKEAREAKNERPRNPRPPRLDPPPARDSLLLPIIIGLCLMLIAAWSILWFAVPAVHGPLEASPTIIIQGTPAEAEAIRAWLAPEIAASNLNWEIIAVGSRRELAEHLNSGGRMDVLIIVQDLAAELYEAGLLAPLLPKADVPSFSGAFSPLWHAEPFTKTLGWAIPAAGDVDYARHLYTLFQQFVDPFQRPQTAAAPPRT